MNILVIGGGGREHALAWKIAQSPRVAKVFVAPGNAGTAREPGLTNVAGAALADLVAFAAGEPVALTVVGPEAPLAAGIVDAFRAAGLGFSAPRRPPRNSRARRITRRRSWRVTASRPRSTGPSWTPRPLATTSPRRARPSSSRRTASRPARAWSSRGAWPKRTRPSTRCSSANAFGAAGARVVVEEYLAGEEASFIVMADGRHVLPLASSQDHKRLQDHDRGPNTGGMGAYSPAPVVTPAMHARIMREVILPTVSGMARDGVPYAGFLYAGVMIDAAGNPKVLEFNCRLGDPETQPMMVRLKSDLVDLIEHGINGTLDRAEAAWDRRAALGVVLAASGYPDAPRAGDVIEGSAA